MLSDAGSRFDLGAITDEFAPDLDVALDAMVGLGMTTVELRTIAGRNIVDLDDEEVERARGRFADLCDNRGSCGTRP